MNSKPQYEISVKAQSMKAAGVYEIVLLKDGEFISNPVWKAGIENAAQQISKWLERYNHPPVKMSNWVVMMFSKDENS